MPAPDGQRLMHGHLKIGDADLFVVDDFPEMCGGKSQDPLRSAAPASFSINMCQARMKRSPRPRRPAPRSRCRRKSMFWGDRYGQVVDPFGHTWSFAYKLAK